MDSDIYVKSHLSGRDAMTIATEARFDKIVDILNITDKLINEANAVTD